MPNGPCSVLQQKKVRRMFVARCRTLSVQKVRPILGSQPHSPKRQFNSVPQVPQFTNEKILGYLPGSTERAEVQKVQALTTLPNSYRE